MNERDIFIAARQLQDPAEREAFLDKACAGDRELRRRVVALLAEQAQLGSFLEHNPPPAATLDATHQEIPGAMIGPYKLIEPIGEGGMGTVWMAQQTEPVKRLVALKLIKAGMDSKQIVARFEAERQALALMDHPNIAKVLDAGTTPPSPPSQGGAWGGGRPYFVMELVKGIPITKYCDEHRLTPRQRLELFVPVCQAVQHAHQKGIIHRDLKPSNVLVAHPPDPPLNKGGPGGVPKVIDFGVAKAAGQSLTDKTLVTGFGAIVGTLEYMSPEQAELNQLDIDTRSDVYALGVLLYELLAGSPPFSRRNLEKAGMLEMLRVIREQEPPKPSIKLSTAEGLPTLAANRGTEPARLTKLVRGELDWIVMKALEKDRNRRYETANGFALDVQHYLNDEPVLACPPSAGYRLRKYARKHRVGLLAASVVILALVAGTAVSTWQAIRATRAVVAERKALDEATQAQKEEAAQRREAVEAQKAAEDARTKADQERQRAEGALTRVTAEQKRAEDNLDLALQALDAVYLDAIGQDKLLGPPSLPADDPNFVPRVYAPLTELEKELLKRGLSFYDQFAGQNVGTPQATRRSAQAYHRAGQIRAALGDRQAAHTAFLAAIERFERLLPLDPENIHNLSALGHCHASLARTIADWTAARPQLERALQYFNRTIAIAPKTPWAYNARAGVHASLGHDEDFRNDSAQAATLSPDDHGQQVWAALNVCHYSLPQARKFAEQAIKLQPDHPMSLVAMAVSYDFNDPEHLNYLSRAIELAPDEGVAYERRAICHQRNGQYELARLDIEKAMKLMPDREWSKVVAAEIYVKLKRYDEVEKQFQRLWVENPNLAAAYRVYGYMYLAQGQYEKADEYLTKCLAVEQQSWYTLKRRAEARFRLGRFADALSDLRTALELDPLDLSTLVWIPLADVARCPSEDFKQGLLKLADDAVARPESHLRTAQLYRGEVRAACGRFADAEADFAAAAAGATPDRLHLWGRLLTYYTDHKKLDSFIQLATPALNDKAEAAALWNWRGIAYQRLGNFSAALADYRRAAELSNKAVYHGNQADALAKLQRHTEAVAAASEALKLAPANRRALQLRAEALVSLRRWPEAIQDYATLLEQEPQNRTFILARAKARRSAGDEPGATADFQAYVQQFDKQVADNPTDWQAWNGRGVGLTYLRNWEAALADFDKAVAIDAKQPLLHQNRAVPLYELARWTDAAAALTKKGELAPLAGRDYYYLALCWLGAGNLPRYRETCAAMLPAQATATDVAIANICAWTATLAPRAVANYDDALALAQRALQAQPANPHYLSTYGALLLRAGRVQEALAKLNESLKQNTEPLAEHATGSRAYTLFLLALAQDANGDKAKAGELFQQAVAEAERELSAKDRPVAWNRRLTLDLLRREAETALGMAPAKPPAPAEPKSPPAQ